MTSPFRQPLSPHMSYALHLLKQCADHDGGWGVVCSDHRSAPYDGQAWIGWRTARALKRRGLVEFDTSDPDNTLLKLTSEGFNAA